MKNCEMKFNGDILTIKNEKKFDNKYYEKYAMLSLEYCYNNSWNSFILSDKPDLQNSRLDIGIEVRRAISEYEGMCNGIVNKYFNKGLNGEFIKNEIEKNLKKFKGEVGVIDNRAFISGTKGLYDPKIHLNEIKNAILSKTCKLITIIKSIIKIIFIYLLGHLW